MECGILRVTISNNLMSNFKLQEEMKKLSFILGLALGMLAVGCSNDPIVENNTPELGNTVTLGVSLDEQTRTSLGGLVGDKCQVLWSAGDKIAVNGIASDAVAEQYVGTSSAKFTVASVTAPYSIVYPAEAIDKNGQLNLPTFQAYASGSFASGTAVMAGYATDNNVSMKHLLSVIKLTIAKGSETESAFNAISITALDGSSISGVFDVDYQGAEIAPMAGKDIVTITNVPIVDGEAVVYVAVPAGDYTKGLGVKVVGSDFSVMSRTAYASTGIVLGSGYLVNMPELTFAGKTTEDIIITTAEQLQTLRKTTLAKDNTFNGKIKLGCDIDMTGVVTDGDQAYLYAGATFDGQGFAITNWETQAALIGQNFGTVKNVVIDNSCKVTFDMSNIDAHTPHAVVVAENLGVVSGCVNNADITVEAGDVTKNRYVGSIVGLLAVSNDGKAKNINASVKNCINNGKIKLTLNSYTSGWFFAGGIVGSYYEYKTFGGEGGLFNCVNNGNLEVNVGTIGNKSAVGGLIGGAGALEQAAALCTIKDCVNNGAVTYNITTVNNNSYIGGIAGSCAAHVVNTTNNGDVTVTVPELGQVWFRTGGVVGDFAGNLTNVHNSGKVKVSLTTQAGKRATPQIGGVAAFHKGSTVAITNSTNSGEVNVATSLASSLYVGGILAQCSSNKVTMTGCENSGNITTVNTADTSGTGSRVWTAGIVADSKADTTIEGCVNRGAISLSGDLTKESSVGGLAATNYCTFNNCKSLGNLHIEDTSELAEYVLIAAIGCRQGVTTTWNGGEVNCAITYEGANVVCGILQGKFWGSTTVGETTPLVIKSTTTINGVAVTADDVANHAKLVAFDEGIKKENESGDKVPVEQVSDPDLGGANTIGTADRTKSKFIIADGGVVLD